MKTTSNETLHTKTRYQDRKHLNVNVLKAKQSRSRVNIQHTA